jgi:hypothetical protein
MAAQGILGRFLEVGSKKFPVGNLRSRREYHRDVGPEHVASAKVPAQVPPEVDRLLFL